jgi:hypothetical protein
MPARCLEAMTELASGVLTSWRGLPAGCTRADVEAVLAPVSHPINPSTPSSGPIRYAATAGAPFGLTVHYEADIVDYILVISPRLERPADEVLGAPEGRLRSELEGSSEQWVYARLGLALHWKSDSPHVSRLYAFVPTTLDEYRTSALSRVRTRRHEMPRGPEES